MKRLILLVAAVMITSTAAFAQKIQESNVPSGVKSAFMTAFPNAKNVQWEKESNGYKAMFKNNNAQQVVHLYNSGDMHKTVTRINSESLPTRVRTYTTEKYPGENFREVEKITDRNGNVNYKLRIKETDHYFDANGDYVGEKLRIREHEKVTKDGKVKETYKVREVRDK